MKTSCTNNDPAQKQSQPSQVVEVAATRIDGCASAGISKSMGNPASINNSGSTKSFIDVLAVEEPLEIHVASRASASAVSAKADIQSVAVTMRTPGADAELAAGFLFTEGIIADREQIDLINDEKCNVVIVSLKAGVELDPHLFERHSFVASSCGVCGKKSIAAVRVKRRFQNIPGQPCVSTSVVNSLSHTMRAAQAAFETTGGIHASALYTATGNLIVLREDVGRHNALDKVIGSQLLAGALPLQNCILMVSGRASFELVQKASHAGIPVLAAVGAPSSLAVNLAEECGMTLLGFVRDDRFNIYSGAERIQKEELTEASNAKT